MINELFLIIKGDTIVDVGAGGGVMLDMIEEETEDKRIYGIDISENVIDTLKRRSRTRGVLGTSKGCNQFKQLI